MKTQVDQLLSQAETALAEGDPGLAARHYRAVLQLQDRPEVRALLDAATRELQDNPAASWLEQARYEEDASAWPEAAATYARAYARRA